MMEQDSGMGPQQEDPYAQQTYDQQQYGTQPYAQTGPKERPIGVTILAVLYFIQSGIFFSFPFILAMMTDIKAADVFANMVCFAPILLLGLIPLGIGVGMIKGVGAARIIALIFAIIGLIGFPVGTIISIIMIIYLRKPEVKAWFD